MANEIFHNFPSGDSLDAYVFKKTNDQVFDEANGGNVFEVWVNGNVLNYDIPMTDQGGNYYSVDFPSVITTAGVYRVAIAVRDGASATIFDIRIAQGEINWNGTTEDDLTSISSDIEVVNSDLVVVASDVVSAGSDINTVLDTVRIQLNEFDLDNP